MQEAEKRGRRTSVPLGHPRHGGRTTRRDRVRLLWLPVWLAALPAACGTAGADAEGREGEIPPTLREAQEAGRRGDTAAVAPGRLVELGVGGRRVLVEIADDPAERSRGLMHRESLPEDQGMLFVYPEERDSLGFWMKNTLIPLDIAFVDRELRIVDIQRMEPLDETTRYSAAPAMYALEMNAGWFEKHGVRVGDRIEF